MKAFLAWFARRRAWHLLLALLFGAAAAGADILVNQLSTNSLGISGAWVAVIPIAVTAAGWVGSELRDWRAREEKTAAALPPDQLPVVSPAQIAMIEHALETARTLGDALGALGITVGTAVPPAVTVAPPVPPPDAPPPPPPPADVPPVPVLPSDIPPAPPAAVDPPA